MRRALLDTDILSEFLKQKNPAVLKNAAAYLADFQQFAISAMTRYEVMRGLKDKGASHQLKKFKQFCQHAEVFPITDEVLDRTSDLWAEARKGGHPRRDPDLIIAATALEHGRVLVTDEKGISPFCTNITILYLRVFTSSTNGRHEARNWTYPLFFARVDNCPLDSMLDDPISAHRFG